MWKISLLSSQFQHEPITALKNKILRTLKLFNILLPRDRALLVAQR